MADLYIPENLIRVVTEDGKIMHHFRHVLASNFLLIKDYLDDFPTLQSFDMYCQQEDFMTILNYFDRNIYPETDEEWIRISNVVEYLNPPLTHLNRLYQSALGYLEKRDGKSYRGKSVTLEDAFKKIRDPTYLTTIEIQDEQDRKMKEQHDREYGELEVMGVPVTTSENYYRIRPAVEPRTFRQKLSRFFEF